MKTNAIKIIAFLLLLLVTGKIFSQRIIDYGAITVSGTPPCNFFGSAINIPATLDGVSTTVAHRTTIGQPTYDGTGKAITLDCRDNVGQLQGTEYYTTITFKKDYSYKITISAMRIMSQPVGSNANLRIDLSNSPNGSNSNCNGTAVIDGNTSGNLKRNNAVVSTSFQDYEYNYSPLSGQLSYLSIAAVPPSSSVLQTIYIKKITIEEIPPVVSFSLNSSVSSIVCGTTTPITFTINNNGTTTASNYSWNLGATPNGWLYNGSPAPQTISTGTTNTLSLTPACTNTRSNINAAVTANGTVYNTNSSAITTNSPTLSIIGSQTVCSSSSYTINNLPCDATVNWSLNNSTANLSAATGSSVNVSYVSGGTNILTAVVNSTSCGNTTISKTLTIGGTQQSGSIYVNASNGPKTTTWGTWNVVEYGSSTTPIIVTMSRYSTWSDFSGPVQYWWTSTNPNNTHSLYLIPDNYPFFTQYITATVSSYNECGQYTSNITYFQNYTAVNNRANYEIGPNPTDGELIVSIKKSNQEFKTNTNKSSTDSRIFQVEVISPTGRIIKRVSAYSSQARINIAGNPPGLYILRIFDGNNWASEKIILR